jgi:hypothetical protein
MIRQLQPARFDRLATNPDIRTFLPMPESQQRNSSFNSMMMEEYDVV